MLLRSFGKPANLGVRVYTCGVAANIPPNRGMRVLGGGVAGLGLYRGNQHMPIVCLSAAYARPSPHATQILRVTQILPLIHTWRSMVVIIMGGEQTRRGHWDLWLTVCHKD